MVAPPCPAAPPCAVRGWGGCSLAADRPDGILVLVWDGEHRGLRSFPTRRSSELGGSSRGRGRRWRAPGRPPAGSPAGRSEEHTSELQSRRELVCRLPLEKKKHFHLLIVRHVRTVEPAARSLQRRAVRLRRVALDVQSSHGSTPVPCRAPMRRQGLGGLLTGRRPARRHPGPGVGRRTPRPTLFPYTTLFRAGRIITRPGP